MSDFLKMITGRRREQVEAARSIMDPGILRSSALERRHGSDRSRLASALSEKARINVIAEIKRASPSKGTIKDEIDVPQLARSYEAGGAAAVSVLTEQTYFHGTVKDLEEAVGSVSIPILRKDFIVHDFQIWEAAALGADAILLIVAGLERAELDHLYGCTGALGMDALVEVHNEEELKIAVDLGAKLVGVNSRDLNTLEVSLDTARRLVQSKPGDVLMIAESGISSAEEIRELHSLGFDGFLIGEMLMRSDNPAGVLDSLSRMQPS